eukprot:Clim_evm21s5 gene=Clim_evmTU21s5
MDIVKEDLAAANELMVDDQYAAALQKYNDAAEKAPEAGQIYAKRSAAQFKLGNYTEAVADVDKALTYGTSSAILSERKGKALYQLSKFAEAHDAFIQAVKEDPSKESYKEWQEKAGQAMEMEKEKSGPAQPASQEASMEVDAAKPQIKHEWYQTDAMVVITIFQKKIKADDLTVNFSDQNVDITLKLGEGREWNYDVDLFAKINVAESTHKIYGTKIEVRMPKASFGRWDALEKATQDLKPTYPSSSKKKINWDQLEKEVEEAEKNEKLEGDAALNRLFQNIYKDSSEEVRRAMNKSFMESGGTVLSTNWGEVGEKEVKPQPPEGMEAKTFDEK